MNSTLGFVVPLAMFLHTVCYYLLGVENIRQDFQAL